MYIRDFIFCDDIRQELGNKHSLMGIYGDDLNFTPPKGIPQKWPINKPLGLFIRLVLDDNDDFDNIKIKIAMEDYTTKLPEFTLPFDSSKIPEKQFNIASRIEPLLIPGPGKLIVYISFLKQNEVKLTLSEITINVATG